MLSFFRCFLGPRVYRKYRVGSDQGRDYEGNILEHYSDSVLRTAFFSLSMAWSLGFYSTPVLLSIMYRKGYFTAEGAYSLCKLSSTVGFILFVSIFVRGIGRFFSSDYIEFIGALESFKQNKKQKAEISCYDFDFREWPVDFRWNESIMDFSKPKVFIESASSRRSTIDKLKGLPCGVLSYVAMHSFGRPMIYPGSVGLLNMIMAPMLFKGRAKLIEDYNGERFKLLAKDDNEIDAVFIDRRRKADFPDGNILVICCEGNSGFYEYGITLTPIDAGYSVLGWNHPGFGSSTGIPYPDQDLNAMDVVMHFAVSKLGFKLNEIVLYAWSIGGFSATWAAMNYPDIKGLILDATFDDLVALAVAKMPLSWKPLVVRTIRDYMDLNNAEQLKMYSGPVLLIRRTRDEIIATKPSRSLQTNRGNDLLIKMMTSRYPKLVNDDTLLILKEWLAGDKTHQSLIWSQQGVEEDLCETTLTSFIEENGFGYPIEIGDGMPADMKRQLILYLAWLSKIEGPSKKMLCFVVAIGTFQADKYMLDFDSTHCIPLPSRFFQLPWNIRLFSLNQRHQSRI